MQKDLNTARLLRLGDSFISLLCHYVAERFWRRQTDSIGAKTCPGNGQRSPLRFSPLVSLLQLFFFFAMSETSSSYGRRRWVFRQTVRFTWMREDNCHRVFHKITHIHGRPNYATTHAPKIPRAQLY